MLVDRSGGQVDFGVPLVPLATLDIETWVPADCPLCAAGTPLIKPGTTQVPARRPRFDPAYSGLVAFAARARNSSRCAIKSSSRCSI